MHFVNTLRMSSQTLDGNRLFIRFKALAPSLQGLLYEIDKRIEGHPE
jgi:hypothetical protein